MELKGYRIAGSLYLLDNLVSVLLGLGISIISTIVGLALLLVQNESKLEALRFVVFAWVALSIILVLIGSASLGLWIILLSTLFFGSAIVGLMMNDLSQQSIALLGGVGVLGIIIPVASLWI
ncbi:hypothetical protein [Kineobactrum salinum]|uniref:Uncharacterized protein n=1 Tax=Kineobactrum salinum TaxID=2708301 RepID=A0A6C0U113_9GAMM|nr:hypothetical protein [Kineobactrum salinum]QIB65721.1 hypothetical protein G3T16_10140 [Kineobactrum salinum]